MGQSPESTSYNSDKQGVPFYQGNADFGAVYPNPRIWCNKPIKLAKENDILISVRAPVGALNFSKEECCIGRGLAAITLDSNDFLLEFIYWSLRTGVKELQSKSTGSTFKSINKKTLEEVRIPKISLKEQKDIIRNLTLLTNILAKYKHEIVFLDELVKARFVEMFGDPVENTMNWPEIFIGDKCFVTKLAGFEYTQYIDYEESGEVVMVKAQNVKNGKLNRKDLSFISKKVSDSLPRSQLAPGDVVMTYVGANIGDVAVIDDVYKYHLAPNVAKIRPNAEVYNSIYFMYMLMLLNIYIVKNSADTAKAALGMEKIRKLKVFIPPLELQNQFASFVQEIDKSRSRIQKSLEASQELFDSLMQEYFG